MQLNESAWKRVVLDLIGNDEVETALTLLNRPPGRHRDNPPLWLYDLRLEIQRKILTPHDYRTSSFDAAVTLEGALNAITLFRGILIEKEVQRLNHKGLTPDLIEFGPGEYFVPIAMQHHGLKFAYSYLAMDEPAENAASTFLKDIPASLGGLRIFIANEIIEHLIDERELVWLARKNNPDIIHISTPCYCFDPKALEELPEHLPHLRTYTPLELSWFCRTHFPEYSATIYTPERQPMSIRLVRDAIVDKDLLTSPA